MSSCRDAASNALPFRSGNLCGLQFLIHPETCNCGRIWAASCHPTLCPQRGGLCVCFFFRGHGTLFGFSASGTAWTHERKYSKSGPVPWGRNKQDAATAAVTAATAVAVHDRTARGNEVSHPDPRARKAQTINPNHPKPPN